MSQHQAGFTGVTVPVKRLKQTVLTLSQG